MANQQNLIPNSKRSPNELRENGRKGGKKSGEVRRQRKTLKEELVLLLESKSYNEKISLALVKQASNGNTKAFEIIRDTIGEKPKETVEVNQDKPFQVNINIKK